MKWPLIVVLTWGDMPPTTTLKVPLGSNELCERAAEQVETKLGAKAVKDRIAPYSEAEPRSQGVITTCIRVAD